MAKKIAATVDRDPEMPPGVEDSEGVFVEEPAPRGSKEAVLAATDSRQILQATVALFRTVGTTSELYRLGEWVKENAIPRMGPEDVATLRADYTASWTQLQGKVKLDELSGKTIVIDDLNFWESERFENEGFTIIGHLPSGKKFQALTSSAVLVRFFSKIKPEDLPVSVVMTKRPHKDPGRAAKGQTIWSIKRLPTGELGSFQAVPF